jgi:predicted RecA/RadA family phage recombinase
MKKMKKLIGCLVGVALVAGLAVGAMNFVRNAGYVIYTAGSDITAGDVVDLGDQYGIAVTDIDNGDDGVVRLDGIWDLTLQTNETISVGDRLYWDSSNEVVTETATADTFIGTAMEAKTTTTSTTKLQVWLQPPWRQVIPGTDVQAYDADLLAIGALAKTDGNIIVGNGTTWVAESGATARTSLGLTIGTNVQAWDDDLDDLAALTHSDGNIIVSDGTNWVAESGATARTSLGLGSGISTNYSSVTNFDITFVNGVVTAFTSN